MSAEEKAEKKGYKKSGLNAARKYNLQEWTSIHSVLNGEARRLAVDWWTQLDILLSEDFRYYHNHKHVAHMLQGLENFDLCPGEDALCRTSVKLATFFHDAIYDANATDNEERSKDLFLEYWESVGRYLGISWCGGVQVVESKKAKANMGEVIAGWIMRTKKHHSEGEALPTSTSERVFLDLDLAILHSPLLEYLEYANNVRREYKCYNDLAFAKGRQQFLRKIANHDGMLYFYSKNANERDTVARVNVEKEANMLYRIQYIVDQGGWKTIRNFHMYEQVLFRMNIGLGLKLSLPVMDPLDFRILFSRAWRMTEKTHPFLDKRIVQHNGVCRFEGRTIEEAVGNLPETHSAVEFVGLQGNVAIGGEEIDRDDRLAWLCAQPMDRMAMATEEDDDYVSPTVRAVMHGQAWFYMIFNHSCCDGPGAFSVAQTLAKCLEKVFPVNPPEEGPAAELQDAREEKDLPSFLPDIHSRIPKNLTGRMNELPLDVPANTVVKPVPKHVETIMDEKPRTDMNAVAEEVDFPHVRAERITLTESATAALLDKLAREKGTVQACMSVCNALNVILDKDFKEEGRSTWNVGCAVNANMRQFVHPPMHPEVCVPGSALLWWHQRIERKADIHKTIHESSGCIKEAIGDDQGLKWWSAFDNGMHAWKYRHVQWFQRVVIVFPVPLKAHLLFN